MNSIIYINLNNIYFSVYVWYLVFGVWYLYFIEVLDKYQRPCIHS